MAGTIHIEPRSGRFSDAWESFRRLHESRKFFPITDATITRTPDVAPVHVPFLVVDRDEIVAAYPLDT